MSFKVLITVVFICIFGFCGGGNEKTWHLCGSKVSSMSVFTFLLPEVIYS